MSVQPEDLAPEMGEKKATGSEALSLTAEGNKHKGFFSSKPAAGVSARGGRAVRLSLMRFTEMR